MKKRIYKKGPSLAPRAILRRKAKKLNKLAYLSFVFAFLFIFLVNPFLSIRDLTSKFKNLATQFTDFTIKIANFPQKVEENTFNFFDWTQEQLINYPILAWNETEANGPKADKEAGQSALVDTNQLAELVFSIEIPSLELNEKVSSNVNPNIAREYKEALEEGVAHAKGSAFPGQEKMIYIFGHSTDGLWNVEAYNAVFYQIKELEIGDKVILHLGDQSFEYRVSASEVIASTDVDFVNDKQDQNILLLQTCWPPGTSWQRLFVTAEPV
jgi:LPXTG-site transpeptidase (sortase) family protein